MEKNTITINKKVLQKTKTIDVSGDVIVPDSKSDVSNIIAVNVIPYINKEEILNSRYRFDGNLLTNIIYLSSNGENIAIQTNFNFMEFIDDQSIDENVFTKYKINVVQIESKILNERKINVSLKLEICINFFKIEEIEYLDQFDDIANIEKMQKNINVNSVSCRNKINTSFQDDLIIESGNEISNILKSDINILNIENKASYNKVLSKADIEFKVLYLNQDMKIESFSSIFPITNFIDMENINEENTFEIDYKICNVDFRVNQNDRNKMNCKVDFEVSAIAYKMKEINLIEDMYGIDKDIEFEYKSVELCDEKEKNNDIITVNESVLIEDIRQIYDVEYMIQITNKENFETYINFSGEICASVYYTTGNIVCAKKVKIPFAFKTSAEIDNIEINLIKKHFKLNGEYVIFDLELEVLCGNVSDKKINLICNIKEKELINNDKTSMIIYLVKPEDTIWKIAKNFKVPMNDIVKLNNFEDKNTIFPGEKVYILK